MSREHPPTSQEGACWASGIQALYPCPLLQQPVELDRPANRQPGRGYHVADVTPLLLLDR